MRYLITVSYLTPGSGLTRYVFSLCRLLERNNEVWVMTTHDDGTGTYEREELRSISSDIHLVSLGNNSKLAKYVSVVHWIRRIKPDVIVNNYSGVIQYVLPLIDSRIKFVHILHCDWTDFYRIGAINGNRTTAWIAPTPPIAAAFNSYSSNQFANRVKVIPHGVEESEFPLKHNNKLEIVYAGVLYEHKGVSILPAIIQSLKNKGIDLHFTIIGGGIMENWLKEQFSEDIASGVVEMTGVIPHDDVYARMSGADIFLYPTHLDAFGLVIAEAMMCGAVPVVTLLPDITDNLITDGEDGFLLERDNVEQFVNKIVLLNSDVELRRKMQKAAYNTAKNNLSLSKMYDNYKLFFSEL